MYAKRKLVITITSIMGLIFCESCSTSETTTLPDVLSVPLCIDSTFSTQSLNQRVLVSTKLAANDLTRPDLKKWLKEHTDSVSQTKDAILLGSYRQYPDAWFFTQIINTRSEPQPLVVDEYNRLRCDTFEMYSIENGELKKIGSLNRNMPFSKYPLPFFTYAIPLTLQPKDTLTLAIHTQRHFGVHEVNLNISTNETYWNTRLAIFLTRVFQLTFFMIMAVTMVILGQVFGSRSMIYWGLGIVTIVFVYITTWGYIDPLIDFPKIGLSGSNVSVFGMMVAITPPLFILEWMKPIPKNEKVFIAITYALFGVSLFFTVCYLFPISLYNRLQDVVNLPLMMIILTLLNIVQFFYYALVAWIRARVYYLFLGLLIAYAPFFLSQIALFNGSSLKFLKSDNVIILFITLGTAYVGICLLREQLVSRKQSESNLKRTKEIMDAIRKTEVEAIGRNLHDQVGNTLASALGYLNITTTKAEEINKLILNAINDIRFLSHNLVKDEDLPLVQKLAELIERFNDFSEISFEFKDFSNAKVNDLDKITQQNIFMIIQEALTNAMKHANAKEVIVQVFEKESASFQFIIEDDGIGFTNLNKNKGIGLYNIYKRAEISNLKLTIDSTCDGTNFIIETQSKND